MNIFNILSLIIEALTALTGLWIGLAKGRVYGYLIALTFLIYVIYDLSRFINAALPGHDLLFLTASLSIFIGVWLAGKN